MIRKSFSMLGLRELLRLAADHAQESSSGSDTIAALRAKLGKTMHATADVLISRGICDSNQFDCINHIVELLQ